MIMKQLAMMGGFDYSLLTEQDKKILETLEGVGFYTETQRLDLGMGNSMIVRGQTHHYGITKSGQHVNISGWFGSTGFIGGDGCGGCCDTHLGAVLESDGIKAKSKGVKNEEGKTRKSVG